MGLNLGLFCQISRYMSFILCEQNRTVLRAYFPRIFSEKCLRDLSWHPVDSRADFHKCSHPGGLCAAAILHIRMDFLKKFRRTDDPGVTGLRLVQKINGYGNSIYIRICLKNSRPVLGSSRNISLSLRAAADLVLPPFLGRSIFRSPNVPTSQRWSGFIRKLGQYP
jgi:hypothetical protein